MLKYQIQYKFIPPAYSKDNTVVEFGQVLSLAAQEMRIGFTLHDKTVSPDSVFSNTGLLPAFIRRADQLCSFCFGYNLGVTFNPVDNAQLGIVPEFDNSVPNVLRLMTILEIIHQLAEGARDRTRIPLDDLMYD